jgi:hypothetical protein
MLRVQARRNLGHAQGDALMPFRRLHDGIHGKKTDGVRQFLKGV